ncbi:hypothetical protein XBI1_1860001 [Xenorhabdus bovienii str. Intermedium]|uniref:Transposase n=1 Tax=Xenorhabdus bovienii str. Intermedium TaxID=1379677 RepID=A0A077QI30_XENBV|nr:hypothetical protein XBI1_1860001 [Xenorhabdus bovienii str. Intermedium]
MIPYRKNSRQAGQRIDKCLYRYRHLVENAVARIKHFRAITIRYDKLKTELCQHGGTGVYHCLVANVG